MLNNGCDTFLNELTGILFIVAGEIDLEKEKVEIKYAKGKYFSSNSMNLDEIDMLFKKHKVVGANDFCFITQGFLKHLLSSGMKKQSYCISAERAPKVLLRFIITFYPVKDENKVLFTVSTADNDNSVSFLIKKTTLTFDVSEIKYIGYGNHCVEIHQSGGKVTKLFCLKYNDAADAFLSKGNFIRTYKNCIVNMDMINRIDSDSFELKDGDIVSVPKKRIKEITQHFNDYKAIKDYSL